MSIVKEKVGEIFSSKFCGDFVVLSYINTAIIKQNKKRGDFPVGVTYHKNTGNFVAQLSTSTGRKHVGAFNNVIDAFAAYRKAKETYLVELAEKWKGSIDERAYDALISYQVSIDD